MQGIGTHPDGTWGMGDRAVVMTMARTVRYKVNHLVQQGGNCDPSKKAEGCIPDGLIIRKTRFLKRSHRLYHENLREGDVEHDACGDTQSTCKKPLVREAATKCERAAYRRGQASGYNEPEREAHIPLCCFPHVYLICIHHRLSSAAPMQNV
eukprot:1059531-Prorocentrum_minimum.AAC.2